MLAALARENADMKDRHKKLYELQQLGMGIIMEGRHDIKQENRKLRAENADLKRRQDEIVDGVKHAISELDGIEDSNDSDIMRHHLMGTITDDHGKAYQSELDVAQRENAEAKDILVSLCDPSMPDTLPKMVEYIINHSNSGWSRVGELLIENVNLKRRLAEWQAVLVEANGLQCSGYSCPGADNWTGGSDELCNTHAKIANAIKERS